MKRRALFLFAALIAPSMALALAPRPTTVDLPVPCTATGAPLTKAEVDAAYDTYWRPIAAYWTAHGFKPDARLSQADYDNAQAASGRLGQALQCQNRDGFDAKLAIIKGVRAKLPA